MRVDIKGFTKPLVESLVAIVIGILVGAIILAFSGYSPAEAYIALFNGALGSKYGLAMTLSSATPIILTALTFGIGARTGLFNIGGEGTVYFGAIMAIILTNLWGNVLMGLFGGILAGMAWMAIPAILKVLRGVNEVVSTIMLNWMAYFIALYIVLQKIPNPEDPNKTLAVPVSARFPIIMKGTELSWAFAISVIAALITYYILWHTELGYELRVSGYNERAARYGGINPKKAIIWSFLLGGIMSGLAGATEVMGRPPSYAISQGMANIYGYGFDGIGVSLVGRNHPLGIIFSGIFFGMLRAGATSMQIEAGVPLEMVKVVQGVIVVTIAIPGLLDLLKKVVRR
ncbi:MAG: ral nucleoside transport system permease protein [Thermococcaceae archaeon]|mgnify:CR=1 FL=1|jgi:simple sugar transport system permease protein|uniref:ABC transporter permease n=1 Tax=unclassified Thermococcus TaxID=2627626 RepID=UPI0005B26FF4|nr:MULTISPECIES: ABC transporter permease [unclassified Thermococcus]KUK00324.1 MAG: ABC-type transport system, permease component [Thermococcales archaeon 44_46]MDK2782641.1 ral nucleoside transport system permease protein [Thermococcaceae archaeon]MDK2853427.1 ral nucleoside transport system permease protein [Thermococcaceae archaeon]MDK2983589.1 ral nucleoside transport system permease protein [Thermococcaceae archaeon]MDN5320758.1 ral nucleoside transport system permease protein [Thermococ